MSSFSGFSEADILKLQNGETFSATNKTSNKNPASQHSMTSKKYPLALLARTNKPSKEARNKIVLESKLNSIQAQSSQLQDDLPDEAKLIKINLSSVPNKVDNNARIIIKEEYVHCRDETSATDEFAKENTVKANDISEKKCRDFEKFSQKQKLMEEQNQLKKQQVAKALEDRTKRTQHEQQKLVEIQNEFKKLDATLSNDVKILRNQIESASYDYMELQKRYHKIEKEFLDAKLHLHQKLEKKEMLTEHLCAIIEKNEERKADKLNELLQKLEVLDGATTGASQDIANSPIPDDVIPPNSIQ